MEENLKQWKNVSYIFIYSKIEAVVGYLSFRVTNVKINDMVDEFGVP